MGTLAIAALSASSFETPLYHPFVTSQGRAESARAMQVTLTLEDGRSFRGESVPVQYVTGETLESVLEVCAAAAPLLTGQDVTNYRRLFHAIHQISPDAPSARCGLEMAVLAACTSVAGISLYRLLGAAVPSVDTDVTIPIVPNAAELAELAWALGMRVFKIKVGDPEPGADLARIRTIRSAAPLARLRIDANQAFTPEAALSFVRTLLEEGAEIELLEQPVPKEDFEGLDFVAQHSPVPVFADESCRTPADALRLVSSTAVHGLNLKLNKCGIQGVLDIIPIAQAAGRKLMLGCMLETHYSIAVSLAIACGTGVFNYIDLDSHLLLNEPNAEPLFEQTGARLALTCGNTLP